MNIISPITNKKTTLFPQKPFWGVFVIVILLAGYWIYSEAALTGTDPYYRDADPEMSYFMNSLAVFKGRPYYYADHPGTPVEILGTILLAVTRPFFPDSVTFMQQHIQNPVLFLGMAHFLVTSLSIGCAILLFLHTLKFFQQPEILISLSIALMFYGLHSYSFTTLTVWSHTSFNFPFGTLYLLFLFKAIYNNNGVISHKITMGLGITSGILIAIMVNFSPWLLTTIICITLYYRLQGISWKQVFNTTGVVFASSAAGFCLSILPAIHRMPYFFGFLQELINHQLPYGNGLEGITTFPLLVSNFLDLFKTNSAIFLATMGALSLCILLLFQKHNRSSKEPGLWAFCIGLLIQSAVLVGFVLKHPGDRFLLPLAATLPMLFLVILKLSENDPKKYLLLKNILITCTLIGTVFFAGVSLRQKQTDLKQTRAFEAQANLAIEEQAKSAGTKPEDMTILWTNLTYSYCSALLQGDNYTFGAFATEMNSICPNQAFFFFRQDWVLYRGQPTALDTLHWDLLVTNKQMLAGNPAWKEKGIIWDYPGDLVIVSRKQ